MDGEFVKYNEIAEILRVLAHPVRLCIVNGLLEKGQCNVGNMQACLGIPQSTVSQHLQKLRTARIIEGKRTGLEINYSICNREVANLMDLLLNSNER